MVSRKNLKKNRLKSTQLILDKYYKYIFYFFSQHTYYPRKNKVAYQNTQLLKDIGYVKHYTSICNSAPSELLSTIALRAGETLLKRNGAVVESNLKLLDHFSQSHSQHFSWVRPQGSCVGFVHYKGEKNRRHAGRRTRQGTRSTYPSRVGLRGPKQSLSDWVWTQKYARSSSPV
jgi:hypothetical protein